MHWLEYKRASDLAMISFFSIEVERDDDLEYPHQSGRYILLLSFSCAKRSFALFPLAQMLLSINIPFCLALVSRARCDMNV